MRFATVALLQVLIAQNVNGFISGIHDPKMINTRRLPLPSSLSISFNWFGGGNKGETDAEATEDALNGSAMGGVSGMVDTMENLRRVQKAGKMTSKLVQELASTTVEGVAADGKVRVTLDCQQRPVGVTLDENYVEGTDVADLCASITTAMGDAHAKSLDKMDDKMRGFYSELGLSSNG